MSNIFNKPIGVYRICSEQKKLSFGILTRARHQKMRLVYDPAGQSLRGWGVYGIADFRVSYEVWTDGSIWHAYSGDAPDAYYKKDGEYMREVEYDDHLALQEQIGHGSQKLS